MMKDQLTEYAYGKGAIRAAGKFMIERAAGEAGDKKFVLIAGVIYADLLDSGTKAGGDDGVELWVGNVVLIPIAKYRYNSKLAAYASGENIGTKLGAKWASISNWLECFFRRQEDKR